MIRLLCAAILIILAVALGCRNDKARQDDLADLTLEESYARLAEAISRPNLVFHAKVKTSQRLHDGSTRELFTRDIWLDLSRDVGRQELRQEAPSSNKTIIIVGDTAYYGNQGAFRDSATVCPGTRSAVISLIPDCGRVQPFREPFAFRVEPEAEYEGEAAVALGVESLFSPEEADTPPSWRPPNTMSWLYLERETFLPIAEVAGPSESVKLDRGGFVSSFENEFVAADSLPPNFLDPASLGPVTSPAPP